MEKFFKVDFVHDDEDRYDKYELDFRDWMSENEDNIPVQELKSLLVKLGQRFTGDSKYPTFESNGYNQVETLVDNVLSMISDRISEDKVKPKDFHEPCLDLITKLLQYGVGTIHMSIIIKVMNDSNIELDEHLQGYKGEKLSKLITSFCTSAVKREDTKNEKFYDEYSSFFSKFIGLFEESQLVDNGHLKTFIDFAAHIYLDYGHLDQESQHNIVQIADNIKSYFDTWKSYRDVDHLKSILKRINVCVKHPEFPKNEEDEMSKRYMLSMVSEISRKPGMAEPFCEEMFELLEASLQSKNKNDELMITFIEQVLRYLHYQEADNIKKKPNLFKLAAPRYKQCIEKSQMRFLISTDVVSDGIWFLELVFGDDKNLVPLWLDLILPLLSRPCAKCFDACYNVMDKEKLIKWKEHQQLADKIIETFASIKFPKNEDEEEEERFTGKLCSCLKEFLTGLKNGRILKKYSEKILLLIIGILEMKRESLYEMASEIADSFEINSQEYKSSVMDAIKRLHALLKDDDLPWNSHRYLGRTVQSLMRQMLSSVKKGTMFTEKDMELIVSVCVTCLSHEGLGNTAGTISDYYQIVVVIMEKLIEWLKVTGTMKLADKLIPLVIQKYEEDEDGDEDDMLTSYNSHHMYAFAEHVPKVLARYLSQILKVYIKNERSGILHPIHMVYPHNPAPLKEHFQSLLKKLISDVDQMTTIWLSQLFHAASQKQPELFTETNVKDILEMLANDPSKHPTLLQIIQELCKRKPEKVVKHIDILMVPVGMLSSWTNDMLCTLALFEKGVANKVFNHLFKMLENQDKANLLTALNSIRMLGLKYLDLLKPRRGEIEAFKTLDPDGQNMKQMILDLIDGKTTEEMQKQMRSQQESLMHIETKVDEVDETVSEVKEEMGKQGEKLDNVTKSVDQQGQRLDKVEETVDETVLKVEEIDGKTLSHAPYWSRDISKLLNPQAKHDWRLLSSRLGYSNDDIRGWAQQADPCMAMLNEWYATRKTSEATLAILTHLQEMDRMDAAVIVENAMKNAEAVVEDEDFVYASPPPVFISYQWGHQEEVKLLKRHLEMAGYECWLDIGQMGGGDKLFEKIDNGIRAAKVVISCVTNKYTKSPNCNREVNLSVGLHKPVIPLLLEQCPWPPPGSMGPIFSESLFIRFFQRNGEETKDNRYWPQPKFLELLMQLNMNGVAPDEDKIEPVYKNWWLPIESEIKIDKNKTKNGGQVASVKSNSVDEMPESPDVFISYQWGKQKNVIKLYERLTAMGFACWLDIKQMGGGDSLYDKIDKGIRGSKVVLSCITQKYALSANCRREVSLADALKKPLLPLMLEDMTWPPPGPMAMVMTQLIYIRFTQEKIQMSWTGTQFDELVNKLSQYIPSARREEKKDEEKPVGESETPKPAKILPKQNDIPKATKATAVRNDPGDKPKISSGKVDKNEDVITEPEEEKSQDEAATHETPPAKAQVASEPKASQTRQKLHNKNDVKQDCERQSKNKQNASDNQTPPKSKSCSVL